MSSGPHWFKGASFGVTQADANGERWQVASTEQGGRVIHWLSLRDGRKARTEAAPAHPDYPSDESLVEASRAAARAKKAARR